MKVNNGCDHIGCLDGIRTLAMLSIVALHMLQIHLPKPFLYNEEAQRQANRKFAKLDFSVDVFFVTGGLTLVYQFFSARDRG